MHTLNFTPLNPSNNFVIRFVPQCFKSLIYMIQPFFSFCCSGQLSFSDSFRIVSRNWFKRADLFPHATGYWWGVVAERSSLPDSSSGVSSRMWVRIAAVTLVSLSKTLNHNCFVLRMGRKAVGPVCCVMHVKEPMTLIVKEKGLAPVFPLTAWIARDTLVGINTYIVTIAWV